MMLFRALLPLAICWLFFQSNVNGQEGAVPAVKKLPEVQPSKELPEEKSQGLVESEKDRLFRKDTILRINEILEKVQQNYPALGEKLADKDIVDILSSLVRTLNCGMEYLPATSTEKIIGKPAEKEQTNQIFNQIFPAIIISGHKVLYIRIDAFTGDSVKQLQTDCVSSFRLANPPVGIIIDLRGARGNNCIDTLKSLGLFITAEQIPLPEGTEPLPKAISAPVLMLVGEATSGSPEIFAKILAESGSGMLLGEKTSGNPFPKQRIQLSNGDFLLVPVVPDYLASIKPESILPAINFTAYPQIEFKKIREEAGSENSDSCLQRAIDLIICLKALASEKK